MPDPQDIAFYDYLYDLPNPDQPPDITDPPPTTSPFSCCKFLSLKILTKHKDIKNSVLKRT